MNDPAGTWLSARGTDSRLVGMLLLSVLVHGVVAALFLILRQEMFSGPPPTEVAYTVKIVDPSALGGRMPTEESDPAPIEIAEVAPEPEKPAPVKEAIPLPEKKPTQKPKPKPTAKKVKKASPTPKPTPRISAAERVRQERDRRIQEAIKRVGQGRQKSVGVNDRRGKALGSGGDGGGGGEVRGLDFIMYKSRVEATIRENWTWVGANPNLTVRVGFSIGSDGRISRVQIVQASGDSGYDASVLRAVRISSPFQPPPEKYRQAFADYLIDFLSGDLQKN